MPEAVPVYEHIYTAVPLDRVPPSPSNGWRWQHCEEPWFPYPVFLVANSRGCLVSIPWNHQFPWRHRVVLWLVGNRLVPCDLWRCFRKAESQGSDGTLKNRFVWEHPVRVAAWGSYFAEGW